MISRRARRRCVLVPLLSLLAACEAQTIPERSGYGARWWLETPIAAPATQSPSPTATSPTAAIAPTAGPSSVALPTPTASARATTVPTEPPTATPTPGFRCEPEVLESEPSAPFDLVGLIEVQPHRARTSGSSALAAAKLQACALGGDAIVILYRNERQGGSPSVLTGPGGMLPSPELRAAVIRYRR